MGWNSARSRKPDVSANIGTMWVIIGSFAKSHFRQSPVWGQIDIRNLAKAVALQSPLPWDASSRSSLGGAAFYFVKEVEDLNVVETRPSSLGLFCGQQRSDAVGLCRDREGRRGTLVQRSRHTSKRSHLSWHEVSAFTE